MADHGTAAATHGGGGGHATVKTYINVAIVLAIITAVEVTSLYIPGIPNPLLVTSLLTMSVIKFFLVVGFFMHLRYDAEKKRQILDVIHPESILVDPDTTADTYNDPTFGFDPNWSGAQFGAFSVRFHGTIELTAKAHKDGYVSKFLKDRLEPGAIVTLSQADGSFALPAQRRHQPHRRDGGHDRAQRRGPRLQALEHEGGAAAGGGTADDQHLVRDRLEHRAERTAVQAAKTGQDAQPEKATPAPILRERVEQFLGDAVVGAGRQARKLVR